MFRRARARTGSSMINRFMRSVRSGWRARAPAGRMSYQMSFPCYARCVRNGTKHGTSCFMFGAGMWAGFHMYTQATSFSR